MPTKTKFEMTHASEKGTRSYQEDRYVVYWVPDEGYLLAVFDGHGGPEAAEICATELVPIFHEIYERNMLPLPWDSIIRNVFEALNEETKHLGSGCAASIAFIPENGKEVIVGVLGDAPVLVRKVNNEFWLSPEHNVRTNVAERVAAMDRGGFVANGYLFATYSGNGLQMSRALGDRYLDSVLSREPEIFRLATGPGSFVLVASDGVFDPSHVTNNSEKIAAEIEAGADAKKLVQNALDVPTNDNVTAILVKL